MQLKLLKIDEFIQLKKLKPVTSSSIPSKNYDAGGLWSEDIFGRIGSENRKKYYGYIELRGKLIHPTAFAMIKTVSPVISSIVNEKKSYTFTKGKFTLDEDGETGIGLLIKHFHEIKFMDLAKPDKLEVAKFIDANKQDLLIDKWIVMPAAIRDIDLTQPGARTIAEINTYYRSLLYLSGMLSGDESMDSLILGKIQRTLTDIVKWIQGNMKGKQGLFRNNLLKKTIDFSTRLVLSSSPDIKLGFIGIPWHVLISIYEPMFTYRIKADHKDFEPTIIEFMKADPDSAVDARLMTKFVTKVNAHPDQISTLMQHQIKEIISEFIDDQVVVAKRDPSISRNSWFSAKPIMIDRGVVEVNSLDLGPIGGDCITGDVSVYAKNNDGTWSESIIDISKFQDGYKCEHIITRTREDGIVVKEYEVMDDVYARGIDINTGKLRMSKIYKWWVHENLSMYNISIKPSVANVSRFDSFECSSDNSLIGFDPISKKIVNFSPSDISENSKLMMIKDCRLSEDNVSIFDMFESASISADACKLEDLGWFIGAWIGDGSILGYDRKNAPIAFSNINKKLHDKWCSVAELISNNKISSFVKVSNDHHVGFYDDASRKSRRSTFNDKNILNFIKSQFGKRSEGKNLPDWCLHVDNEFIIGLLAGLIDTDASVTTNYMSLTSKSTKLIIDLKHILDFKFNITSTIHTSTGTLTDLDYSVLSTRMSKLDSCFWKKIASEVCSDTKRNSIISRTSGNTRTNGVVKYCDIKSVIGDITYDSKKGIVENYYTTSLNIDMLPIIMGQISSNIMKQNMNGELEIIPVSKLKVTKTETTTAYDFTVDPDQRSFITASRLVVKNSDGDTIQVCPLFTEETKKMATEKMNPRYSKSKWMDTSSNGNVSYGMSLDAISAIFNATQV